MKITVGSKNIMKVDAVKDTVALYPELFPNAEVEGVEVNVELFGHPKNLQEIVEGAIQRAQAAYGADVAYSFGIESGLMAVPQSNSGYVEVEVCAVYDGTKQHLGLSPAYEWPIKVSDLIVNGGMDGSSAFKKLGLTDHEKIGAVKGGGSISFLTKGKLTREDTLRASIMMALVQLERPELY